MAQIDEAWPGLAGANMPSEIQIERAARMIAVARNVPLGEWPKFQDIARDMLVICMNQTKIMIGR
jgi:hypothetical protein